MKTREELVLERMNLVSEKQELINKMRDAKASIASLTGYYSKQKELSKFEKTRIAVNDIDAKTLRVNVEINKFHNPDPIGGCNKKEQKGVEVKDS